MVLYDVDACVLPTLNHTELIFTLTSLKLSLFNILERDSLDKAAVRTAEIRIDEKK